MLGMALVDCVQVIGKGMALNLGFVVWLRVILLHFQLLVLVILVGN
jgi:hypothetical protein